MTDVCQHGSFDCEMSGRHGNYLDEASVLFGQPGHLFIRGMKNRGTKIELVAVNCDESEEITIGMWNRKDVMSFYAALTEVIETWKD